ncbi:MAG: branched-chain amino acid ABC transporter permease [Ktedonobacterales bacterium]
MAISLALMPHLAHTWAVLGASGAVPNLFDPVTLFQQLENGIALGAVYALIALGYTMVYGIIELINFAHGDVFMWGSFAALALVTALNTPDHLTGLPLVFTLAAALLVAVAVSSILNVTIERFAYRPLRNAPRLALLIAAIGASFILEDAAKLWKGPSPIRFPPIFPDVAIHIGGVVITGLDIFIILLSIVLTVGLDRFIKLTRMGRAMRATAQDRDAAALMGVSINSTIFITFLIGGALAGAAGLIYSMKVQQVWYFTGFSVGLKAFTAAVLGGIGNIQGAVLGGLLIGLIESFATQFFGIEWTDAIVFTILVLVLVLRPTGLVGVASADKA